jgi:hypothetical protein
MADNIVGIIIGGRGHGKTTLCKEAMRASPLPKKLIADIFDNPVWHSYGDPDVHPQWLNEKIEFLDPSLLARWGSGTCRTYHSRRRDLIKIISTDLRNCFLVIEDARRFIKSEYLSEAFADLITDTKQKNINLFLAFHTLYQPPKELIDLADFITIFKTGAFDSTTGKLYYERSKYRYPGFEKMLLEVEKSPDRYIHRTLQIN